MANATRHITATKAPRKTKKYSIIIPAAGAGTRMITYGAKSLIKLTTHKTVLDRQISLVDKVFGKYEIVLVTGFQSERVMNAAPHHLIQVQNPHYQETNVAYSIGLGLRAATTNNIVILYGDLVFNVEALRVPFDRDSALVVCNTMKEEEVGCVLHKNMVEQIFYGLDNKWAQIAYFTGQPLEMLRTQTWDKTNNKCFTFEVINNILDAGHQIKAFIPKNAQAIDIDTSKDIERAKKIK